MAKVRLRVTPKSSEDKIEWSDGLIKVRVRAVPADGKANEAVCRLLAAKLGLRFSEISLIRGHKSREKTVLIPSLSVEDVQRLMGDE